jgi:DNA polymerase-1
MNLQNVPKGGEFDGDDEDPLVLPNVRSLFLPDEGYEIFDMDLSSADLRVVVWEADEPEMKAMLHEGLDPYTEIAKEFYHDPRITKHDPRRQKFKSFAHGTNYLGTARGLATRLGLSVAEAERTQHWYFGKFPRIKLWQDNLRKDLETKRYVRNAFGYRRFFFDRIDGTVYNQAAAWKPQSTVALLINFIWDRIRRAEHEVDILLQVHDSLVGQYPVSRAEYFRSRLQDLSLIAIPYDDPLVIPTGFKYSQKSWGDCE